MVRIPKRPLPGVEFSKCTLIDSIRGKGSDHAGTAHAGAGHAPTHTVCAVIFYPRRLAVGSF